MSQRDSLPEYYVTVSRIHGFICASWLTGYLQTYRSHDIPLRYSPLPPYGGPAHVAQNAYHPPANDEVTDEEEDDTSDEEEDERELDFPRMGTPPFNDEGMRWAFSPTLRLGTLEELRGSFTSELEDPSGWLLQRFAVLLDPYCETGPRQAVQSWYNYVANLTGTLVGWPLRLPAPARFQNSPFHRQMDWEEASQLRGSARRLCFRRNVREEYKEAARLSIEFLVPRATREGLSALDKKRLFAVASKVWTINPCAAEGLLWVLDKDYPETRHEVGRMWPNGLSEEFMMYTVLFPPPMEVS